MENWKKVIDFKKIFSGGEEGGDDDWSNLSFL